MRAEFGRFEDQYEGPALGRRLRQLADELERLFAKIRPDDQLIIGGGTPIKKYLSTTATWNPGALAKIGYGVSVSRTTTTVTLTGAALGDIALASFSLDLQGLKLRAYVSSANTVTVVLSNDGGVAVDLASGTLRVSVLQH